MLRATGTVRLWAPRLDRAHVRFAASNVHITGLAQSRSLIAHEPDFWLPGTRQPTLEIFTGVSVSSIISAPGALVVTNHGLQGASIAAWPGSFAYNDSVASVFVPPLLARAGAEGAPFLLIAEGEPGEHDQERNFQLAYQPVDRTEALASLEFPATASTADRTLSEGLIVSLRHRLTGALVSDHYRRSLSDAVSRQNLSGALRHLTQSGLVDQSGERDLGMRTSMRWLTTELDAAAIEDGVLDELGCSPDRAEGRWAYPCDGAPMPRVRQLWFDGMSCPRNHPAASRTYRDVNYASAAFELFSQYRSGASEPGQERP